MGLLGDIAGIFVGAHQNKLANKIHPVWNQYQTNPYAKMQLGLAENLFNGEMPGEQQERQSIAGAQSNYNAAIDRNATDSGQALALASGAQTVANNAYSNLGSKVADYKLTTANNLNKAYGTMVNEGDKVYQSMLQKYQMDSEAKAALRNSAYQNIFGGLNDLSGSAFLGGNQMLNDESAGNDKTGNLLSLGSMLL